MSYPSLGPTLLLGPSDTLAIVSDDPQPVGSARAVALHANADLEHFVVEGESSPARRTYGDLRLALRIAADGAAGMPALYMRPRARRKP